MKIDLSHLIYVTNVTRVNKQKISYVPYVKILRKFLR